MPIIATDTAGWWISSVERMPFFIFLRFRYAPRSCNYRNVDEKRDVQSARVSFAQRGGRALRFQIDSVVSNFPPPRKSVSYNEKELSKQPNKAHRGIHIFLCNQANMKWSFYPLSNWNTLLVWPKLCVAYEWICIIQVKINFVSKILAINTQFLSKFEFS